MHNSPDGHTPIGHTQTGCIRKATPSDRPGSSTPSEEHPPDHLSPTAGQHYPLTSDVVFKGVFGAEGSEQVQDDQALWFVSEGELVIILGCTGAGVINMIEAYHCTGETAAEADEKRKTLRFLHCRPSLRENPAAIRAKIVL